MMSIKNIVHVKNRKNVYRSILIGMLFLNMAGIFYLEKENLDNQIPNNIKMIVGTKEEFDFDLPMSANISSEDVDVLSVNNVKIPHDQIDISFNEPFSLESSQVGQYTMNVKLFGLIDYKQINVDVIESVELIPSGLPIGIYIETDGIMVLGTSPISSTDGLNYEPAVNILRTGDYIKEVNGNVITDKEDLINEVQESDGKDISFTLVRNKKEIDVKIKPVMSSNGEYKIGAWIRDDTQGIGTLTYIDSTGKFGALGHGITDIDTNLLMNIKEGSIHTAKIMQIIKGQSGTPGELVGLINQTEEEKIGNIIINSKQGIFGNLKGEFKELANKKPMKIGLKQDIKLGKAYIRCKVEDEIKDYEIQIEKIELNSTNVSKGLVIRITDKRLINITNGIVQGMSGSPIIQDNKIIGAVTHVFIQDSTKGYGTFIENMLKTVE